MLKITLKFTLERSYMFRFVSRKIHSTTLHKTPPYRAQSCISIHPGKEEDTNKSEQEADLNQRQAVDPNKNLENCE